MFVKRKKIVDLMTALARQRFNGIININTHFSNIFPENDLNEMILQMYFSCSEIKWKKKRSKYPIRNLSSSAIKC